MTPITTKLERIVVLLDDTTSTAEQQLPWARLIAAGRDIPLTLFHVVEASRVGEPIEVAKAMARDYLELVATRLRAEPGSPAVDVVVEDGLVQEEWREYSAANPGSLLIAADFYEPGGTHSLRYKPLDGVLGACPTPLLVVPPRAEVPNAIERVVVGTGGDELADAVADYVHTQAAPGVDIIEVEAIERGHLPDHQLIELKPALTDDYISIRGKAGPVILAVARLRDAQLIVVGAHTKGAIRTLLVGSTSQWLARNSDRPVLIVPEQWVSEAAN